MSRYGAPSFPSLLKDCVLWAPLQHSAGVSGDIDEFPILPSGVTVTNNGTFTKTDLGNNKSVLNFDGSTNYISLTDNSAWDIFDSNFTMTMWLNITYLESQNVICSQSVDSDNYWDITWGNNYFALYGEINNVTLFSYYCSFILNEPNWYHIVVQRSDSNCLIYINGISQSITIATTWSETPFQLASPFFIGGNRNHIQGNIKDLMIFNRALTQPEIKLLMNRTHPITGAGLIDTGKYWRLS